MKKISTVIFDVDGTLLNTEQLWGEAWQMIADRYDCPSFRHDYVTGISGKQLEKVLKEHTPDIPDEQREKMLKEARETGMSLIREHVQALPGVMETLQELKKDGYRLEIEAGTEDGSYTVRKWKITREWVQDEHIEGLWPGQ